MREKLNVPDARINGCKEENRHQSIGDEADDVGTVFRDPC